MADEVVVKIVDVQLHDGNFKSLRVVLRSGSKVFGVTAGITKNLREIMVKQRDYYLRCAEKGDHVLALIRMRPRLGMGVAYPSFLAYHKSPAIQQKTEGGTTMATQCAEEFFVELGHFGQYHIYCSSPQLPLIIQHEARVIVHKHRIVKNRGNTPVNEEDFISWPVLSSNDGTVELLIRLLRFSHRCNDFISISGRSMGAISGRSMGANVEEHQCPFCGQDGNDAGVTDV